MLEIRDLHVKFNNRDREAVGGISLEIRDGEIVGLAGQSGSGKTVTAMSIAGLLPRKQCTYSGDILLNGQDLLHAPRSALRKLHGREVGVVFQDPMNAMDPLMRVGEQVGEVLRIHTNLSPAERREKALETMASVELENPVKIYQSYPHELSGGMRQRCALIRTLITDPDFLLLDESFSALDYQTRVSVSVDIRSIIKREQKTALLVTHDIAEAIRLSDRILVMKALRIVGEVMREDATEDKLLSLGMMGDE